MAAVTETEARGAQISVPREASVPEASLKALMDQADAGVRGKGGKASQAAGGKEPGNLAPGARAALGSPETAAEEAEQEEAAEAGIQVAAEADAAVEETVKSPLDPAAPAEAVEASGQEAMEAKTVFTKDELDARLEKARELSWQYQGSVKDENAISAYAAAEQLWTLWDQELNLVYGSIRARKRSGDAAYCRAGMDEGKGPGGRQGCGSLPSPPEPDPGVQKGHGGGNAGPVLRTDGRI